MESPRPPKFSVPVRTLVSVALVVFFLIATGVGFQALQSLKPEPAVKESEKRIYNVGAFVVPKADLRQVISAFGTARSDVQVTVSIDRHGNAVVRVSQGGSPSCICSDVVSYNQVVVRL